MIIDSLNQLTCEFDSDHVEGFADVLQLIEDLICNIPPAKDPMMSEGGMAGLAVLLGIAQKNLRHMNGLLLNNAPLQNDKTGAEAQCQLPCRHFGLCKQLAEDAKKERRAV